MSEQGHRFSWQEGYGAFSVSASNLNQVIRYIQNQEAHHRKATFEDEFRGLLRRHGLEYDPEWVFGQVPGRFVPTRRRKAPLPQTSAHAAVLTDRGTGGNQRQQGMGTTQPRRGGRI